MKSSVLHIISQYILLKFLASFAFCCLLITIVISPDLDPNRLQSDSVPERIFVKKLILKKSADDNKSMKNYPACKE